MTERIIAKITTNAWLLPFCGSRRISSKRVEKSTHGNLKKQIVFFTRYASLFSLAAGLKTSAPQVYIDFKFSTNKKDVTLSQCS
jgi:hypothetical protein